MMAHQLGECWISSGDVQGMFKLNYFQFSTNKLCEVVLISASSDCRWSPRIPQLPHYSSRQHRTWWLLRKEALHDAENHLQLERWVFLTSSFFFCTLTQACVDTKFWKKLTSECQNSMSLLRWDMKGVNIDRLECSYYLVALQKNVGTFIENQTGENFDTNMRPIHSPTIQGRSHCCAWLTLDLITLEGK